MNYQNPFLNPYGFGQQFQQMPVQQPTMQVVKVNGENGAKAYQMGANSSALLLDESGMMVWLVTTDGAGYKSVSAYDIVPHKDAPVPDYGSLESRIKKLEETVNGYSRHSDAVGKEQSDVGSVKTNNVNGKNGTKPTGNA